ncbi:Down syndrome cell adhesion molecule-like protein Dscam2 [Eumeta japonica]|uniref:Down syndrome cell adhesion molecule-like protein Dscam2 n=1 Tax=Eumeta variegata TaxID=151549 RepID=A0A4C1XMR2_EUMVA|nr:Down syndrome cell adhesion molecule-like protein Dscam2 [Eumeta japonica]
MCQGEETTISRLTPYAEYELRARAHNAAGDGPLSAPQLCRTDEDVPSAPGGIKLVALGERSLRASWLPPPEPNGRLTHYSLYVKDLSGSQEPNMSRVSACTENEGAAAECMRSVRGLRTGRTYEAWVRAATAAGEGPPTPAVACQPSALEPFQSISSSRFIVFGRNGLLERRVLRSVNVLAHDRASRRRECDPAGGVRASTTAFIVRAPRGTRGRTSDTAMNKFHFLHVAKISLML